MKRMTFFAFAAMLLSAAVFTACKNGQNEPEKVKQEEVKTEFSISLPNQLKGPRYMPGATVQKEGRSQFQGMTDITLVPFVHQRKIAGTDTRLGDNITLSDIASASELGTNSNATVYTNVSIPLTTASFLFYAQSKATNADLYQVGVLNEGSLNSNNPSAFTFELQTVINALSAAHGDAKAVALLAYLNSIADANDGAATPKAWKNYTSDDDAGMAALFTTFAQSHVLSSINIQREMSDLYNSLVPLTSTLATNIKAAIAAQATVTAPVAPATKYTVVLNSTLSGYPANIKLPDGSVHVKWDASAFRFCNAEEYTAANHALPSLYTYPSSLWYFSNSRIKTSNSSKQAMYNNTNTWDAILTAHSDARAVNSRTRAVAIEDEIQYAVARLDVQVKLEGGVLEDNALDPKSITCASYPITAILVGGQKNVGFDFTPASYAGSNTEVYTIYDSVMTSTTLTTPIEMAATASGYSEINSTLVLETAAQEGSEADKDVIIAVEFQNQSGEDFTGVDGCIIPAGSKFYVLARLEAGAATETGKKVFKQDYTTTAKLNLKNLKNAYNSIPDLRTPQLELGFSVNLTWQAGHTYVLDF